MIVKIPVQFPSHVSGSFERLEVCIRQIRKLEKAIEAAPEEDKNSLRDSLSIIRAALNEATGGELEKELYRRERGIVSGIATSEFREGSRFS